MNYLKQLFFLLSFAFLYSQQAQTDSKLKLHSIEFGAGYSTFLLDDKCSKSLDGSNSYLGTFCSYNNGVNFVADVSFNLRKFLFTFSLNPGRDTDGSSHYSMNYINLDFTVGRMLPIGKVFVFEPNIGVGHYEFWGEDNKEKVKYSFTGIPINLNFRFNTSKKFAVVLNPYLFKSGDFTLTSLNLKFQYKF